MIETVQYALMTETPVVISIVQRLGPSTGGATQGAQGDLLLAEFCTSGGYTLPILCPSTPQQCYELTMQAFNWAEMLRTPVVLLSDKEVGMTSESIDYARLVEPAIVERSRSADLDATNTLRTATYGFASATDVPAFAPVGGPQKVTATGSAHDKHGALRKNDPDTLEVLRHLEAKIQHRRSELALVERDLEPSADTLVIAFGITARAALEAARNARRRGKCVSVLNVQSLFPVPERCVLDAAAPVSRVVVAEENLSGQYRSVLAPLLWNKEIVGVNKIGAMITPGEIEKEIL
jgi:2-oxoglutarate ferredoxin oxidoreductase subunit alpha